MAKKDTPTLTAVFRDRHNASSAYDYLHALGYSSDEINVLMSDQTRIFFEKEGGKHSSGNMMTEGVATGGTIGTVVGATAGAIAAIGTSVLIPGLGMVVAGPILAALAGGGAGAVTGGLIGGLIGLGISESNAKAYEEVLKNGGVVIGVRPRNSDDEKAIKDRFEELGGENIIRV
jgi:hypothetical protein